MKSTNRMLKEPIYTNREVSDLEYFQTYEELQNHEAISNRTIALVLISLVAGNIIAASFIYFGAKAFFNF